MGCGSSSRAPSEAPYATGGSFGTEEGRGSDEESHGSGHPDFYAVPTPEATEVIRTDQYMSTKIFPEGLAPRTERTDSVHSPLVETPRRQSDTSDWTKPAPAELRGANSSHNRSPGGVRRRRRGKSQNGAGSGKPDSTRTVTSNASNATDAASVRSGASVATTASGASLASQDMSARSTLTVASNATVGSSGRTSKRSSRSRKSSKSAASQNSLDFEDGDDAFLSRLAGGNSMHTTASNASLDRPRRASEDSDDMRMGTTHSNASLPGDRDDSFRKRQYQESMRTTGSNASLAGYNVYDDDPDRRREYAALENGSVRTTGSNASLPGDRDDPMYNAGRKDKQTDSMRTTTSNASTVNDATMHTTASNASLASDVTAGASMRAVRPSRGD